MTYVILFFHTGNVDATTKCIFFIRVYYIIKKKF